MSERTAYKDWFDKTAARNLGLQFGRASKSFDQEKYVKLATRQLASKEFGARVKQFSDAMAICLPDSVPRALQILVKSLPPLLPNCDSVTDGWLQWPLGQFIADHGVEHFDESMEAMIELTKRFSSEFAVRPFVARDPERTLQKLLSLTDDPDPHVRRWCSEGSRPRLPWGQKLNYLVNDPTLIWPILEALKDDPQLYVQKSVANNLNDIAKDHSSSVVNCCERWSEESNAGRDWVIKHGLRTLIKEGNNGALAVVGYGPPTKLDVKMDVAPSAIKLGDKVALTAKITSSARKPQNLLIDYAVHYVRQNEKTSEKIFKWTTLTLPPNGETTITKNHPMKVSSVRALYPGVHKIEIQINGSKMAETSFSLK